MEEQGEPTQSAGPQQSNPPTQGLRMKPKPLFIKAHLPNSCHEAAIASRSAALLCSNTLWGDRVHWIWVTSPSLCWDKAAVDISSSGCKPHLNWWCSWCCTHSVDTIYCSTGAGEDVTPKEHLGASSWGAQLSLQWAPSSPSALPHGESCTDLSCCRGVHGLG